MSNSWEIHWKDYYQILQVHPTAEQEVIKATYDRLARKYHPDVNQKPSSAQKMIDINEAYEVLGTLETRRLYHPVWLQKRRESNNRQTPPRESLRPETDERHDTPIHSTTSSSWMVIRWIAVVPAGLAVALLVTFPIHWFIIFWASIGDAPFFGLLPVETIERLVIAFTNPFFIIYVGTLIAPSHRSETSIALAILTALGIGATIVLAFTGGPQFSGWTSLHFGATPVLNLAGIAIALYKIRKRYQ
jgi:hypothetical protein